MNTTPLLKDLYQYITPQYAADWKVIGTLLGIPNGELKAIQAGNPVDIKWCCNQMLEKWLEIDTLASWGKCSLPLSHLHCLIVVLLLIKVGT